MSLPAWRASIRFRSTFSIRRIGARKIRTAVVSLKSLTFDDVTEEAEGKYLLEVPAESPSYSIGRYLDVWSFDRSPRAKTPSNPSNASISIRISGTLRRSRWCTTSISIFSPIRSARGSKQYLKIEIKPNVPRASDLQKYYENLAIVSNLKISLEQVCGPCTPAEEDLRLILDEEDVEFREKRWGYYLLDTEDLDPAVYHIWFKLEMGETVHISPKLQLQIFN
jgi:hypothetical protein